MKRRRRVSQLIISVIVMMSMVVPQFVFADSMNNPKASGVEYYKQDGKKVGIEKFTINPYTYYNVSRDKDINPEDSAAPVINDATLLQITKKEILPKWAVIAEAIFRDQADQLVTIEGGGMMSSDMNASNSFDKQFNYNRPGVDGYVTDWSWWDFVEAITAANSSENGKKNEDYRRVSGIQAISNIAGARDLMGQEIRNCFKDDDNTKDEFLGNQFGKDDNKRRLRFMDDDKTGSGFASIISSVNQAGDSNDYDYASFGIAVYDFDVSPIAASDLDYIGAADLTKDGKAIINGEKGNVDWSNATGVSFNFTDEGTKDSYKVNGSPAEQTTGSSIGITSTVENSVTSEESYQWGMTQHLGGSYEIGQAGASGWLSKWTIEISNEWSELWSKMTGKSSSESESNTREETTQLTMPAHTVATISQNISKTNVKERYQQPVAISYKVAIFAMTGDCYNGLWAGGIDKGTYDKQWMSVIFDGSDQQETSGCYAMGSLYNRAVRNRDTAGYDGAKGKLNSWCDKDKWNKKNKINWKDIAVKINDTTENRASHVITSKKTGKRCTFENLVTEIPMYEQGLIMNTKRELGISNIKQMVPMYSLKTVATKDSTKKRYQLDAGDTFYLDELGVMGYNTSGVDFFGFDPSWGKWSMAGPDGKIITDGGSGDEDGNVNGKVVSGSFTLVNDELLGDKYVEVDDNAGNGSSIVLKWVFDDDVRIASNEELSSNKRQTPYMTKDELSKVTTPAIRLTVKRSSVARDITASGEFLGLTSDKINLNRELDASATADDAETNVPIYWEAADSDGINVAPNGDCSFSEAGEYQVRAFCYSSSGTGSEDDGLTLMAASDVNKDAQKMYSGWVKVTAKNPSVLTTIEFDQNKVDQKREINTENPSVSIDLEKCLVYKDQYGEEMEPYFYDKTTESWTRLVPTVNFIVNGEHNTRVNEYNWLTITAPGEYTVTAKAFDKEGNDLGYKITPAKFVISGKTWLDSVKFNEEELKIKCGDLKLKSLNDTVVVEDLASMVQYFDQNGELWTGAKPEVVFSVETPYNDKWKIEDGNLYLSKTGYFGLWLDCEGLFDRAGINVEDGSDRTDPANLVIDTFDPEPVVLNSDRTETAVHLDTLVDYKTKLDGKYEGEKPEIAFALDGDATKAEIKEQSVVINEVTGETKTYSFLYAKEPGTYVIHVEPKDAAQYSGKIRDITVKVVKKPKKAALKSLRAGKRKLTVTMTTKPSKKGGTRYQIAYKVKGSSKWKYKTTKASKLTIKKVKRGSKYSVKVRAYKTVSGKKYYGAWSKVKSSGKIK